ncbi:MAG: murein hydrolase activator EnvC family protein [Acutalibacteraceae bacterium]
MRGKKLIKYILCLNVFLMVATGPCMFQTTATSVLEKYKRSKAERQNRQKELAKQLANATGEVNEAEKRKNNLDEQISIIQCQIDESNKYISELEKEIKSLNQQVEQIEEEIAHKCVLLKRGLKSIYITGETTTLDIILGAKSFDDFIDKLDMVRSVSRTMQQLMDDLKADLKEVDDTKNKIEKTKSDKEAEKADLEKNRFELQDLVEESEKTIDKLKEFSKSVRQDIDYNDAEIKAIDEEIAKEQKRIEEERIKEERRKEEARKRAEEQRKKEQQQKKNQSFSEVKKSVPKSENSVASGEYTWPVEGYHHITSGFSDTEGRSGVHGAIDIGGDRKNGSIYGQSVLAANSGTVIIACTDSWGGGYGNYVAIDHGSGELTLYGHLSSVSVSKGQKVSKGQVIGKAGNTGRSTGPHLHFEYRVNGKRTNPRNILNY